MKNLKNILFIALACLPLSLAAANPEKQQPLAVGLDQIGGNKNQPKDDKDMLEYMQAIETLGFYGDDGEENKKGFEFVYSNKDKKMVNSVSNLDGFKYIKRFFDKIVGRIEKKDNKEEREEAKELLKSLRDSLLFTGLREISEQFKEYLSKGRYAQAVCKLIGTQKNESVENNEELIVLLGLIGLAGKGPIKLSEVLEETRGKVKLGDSKIKMFEVDKEKRDMHGIAAYAFDHSVKNPNFWGKSDMTDEQKAFLIESVVYDDYAGITFGKEYPALQELLPKKQGPVCINIAKAAIKNKNYYALAYLLRKKLVGYESLEYMQELLKALAADANAFYNWLLLTQTHKTIPVEPGVLVGFSEIFEGGDERASEKEKMKRVAARLALNQTKLAEEVLSSLLQSRRFLAASAWAIHMYSQSKINVIKSLIAQNKWGVALDATTKVDALKEVLFSPSELAGMIADINVKIDWQDAESFIASQKEQNENLQLFDKKVLAELSKAKKAVANEFMQQVMNTDPSEMASVLAELEEESSNNQVPIPTFATDWENDQSNDNVDNDSSEDSLDLLLNDVSKNDRDVISQINTIELPDSSSGQSSERFKKGLLWFSVFVIGGSCVYIVYIKYDELMAFMQKKLNWGKTDARKR